MINLFSIMLTSFMNCASSFLIFSIGFWLPKVLTTDNSVSLTRPTLELSLPMNEIAFYTKEDLIISCRPPVNSVAFDVKWLSPLNETITSTGRIHVETDNVKDDSVNLIITNIHYSDRGNYTCKAFVNSVEVSRTFSLHVLKKIEYVDAPHIQLASEGDDYMIRCIVDGDPKPIVYWRHKYNEDNRFQENPEGLFLRNVSRSDTGQYWCSALQHHAKKPDMQHRIIKLVVEYKPEFKTLDTNKVFSYMRGKVNLTCEAHGEPTPSFEWYHNDELLSNDSSGRQFTNFQSENKRVLEMTITNKSDFGTYVCRVFNNMGSIQKNVTIEEGAVPSKPSVAASVLQANSIELNITSTFRGEFNVSGFRIQYKLAEEFWIPDTNVIDFEIGAKYTVEGLQNGKTYHVRVAAINAAGQGEYCDPIKVETIKLMEGPMTDVENANGSAVVLPQFYRIYLQIAITCFGLIRVC